MTLLLLGCFRSAGDAPFELGRLRAAMMEVQDTTAIVLLSDNDMTCGGFLDELNNRLDEVDSTLWEDNGVLLQLWHDGTLNGAYIQNAVPLDQPARAFFTRAFEDGVVYDDPTLGTLEMAGTEGVLDTGWARARFDATLCTE
mgnify:CR=1 FL=1